ncbi:hypothetical protein C0Q70_17245 [Pomacea canaliculata]|uniref:Uncharacterized protein n=1 Tax=Pomacea canaliculata TaxID=400727 RepID=A0A2T7NS20_POMCA|nr:hypothetical protein C0Q70_17245 [Pomacea canaliculata]
METFTRDTKYILGRLNMSWLGDELFVSDKHAKHEISMLIDDVFHEFKYPFYQNCTNSTDLAIRLWKAFQINGYLPNSIEFPWAKNRLVKQSDLKNLALRMFEQRQPSSKRYWTAQKEQALIEAYSKVPDVLMERVRKMYDVDFTMFQYDPYPDILYRHLPNTDRDIINHRVCYQLDIQVMSSTNTDRDIINHRVCYQLDIQVMSSTNTDRDIINHRVCYQLDTVMSSTNTDRDTTNERVTNLTLSRQVPTQIVTPPASVLPT